ncbi:MAG: PKD domain-containing protein [Ginsengibacter sp.]
MRNGKFWGLILFCLIANLNAFTQDFSNKGKDFWIGYGNHVRMFNNQGAEQMQVYITSDVNTTGSVDIPGIGFTSAFTITANQITTINIPRTAALTDEGLYNTGIHIVSALPVVVYSFIYVSAISGATVCLPTNVLGREYYSVNYTQISNDPDSYSYFFVVATEDNTVVQITPTARTKGGKPANIPFTVTLNKGQIYQVLGEATSTTAGADLTGSSIRSVNTGSGCKRIAVFCGSGKISIGCTSIPRTSDNLYQEIYPISSWGKKYITTPTTNDGSNYQVNFYRIIRPDPATIVKLNGTIIPSSAFTNNFYYEFSNNTTNIIEGDKAIFLAQYLTTSTATGNSNCGNNGIGDPDMIYINPVEQTINKVTLNSMQPSSNTNITAHFVNVVMKNSQEAINTFQIDGVSKASDFKPVSQDNSYVYARIQVSKGTHNISCDSAFNAIAYGFGSFESYGYSAGANLRDLYQYITIENSYSTTSLPATCKNSPFWLDIVLPYQPLNLTWQFNGLLTDTLIQAPVADSSWVINGRTLYKYKLLKTYQLNQTGSFPIKVIADNPSPDGCSGKQEIDMDLQVYNRPAAAFDTSFSGCLYDSIQLSDKTITDRPNIKWSWQLGDGSISNSKNLTHGYNKAGTYLIQFSSINDIGCFSDTIQKTFKIDELPVASFKLPAVNCGKNTVLFSNLSTLPTGVSAVFYWDFGDGVKTSSNSLSDVSHQYAAEKNYATSMYAITQKGCKSNIVNLPLAIHYKPQVDFMLPEICISDAYADFKNTSVIGDSTQSQFSYLWNFDDAANSNPANPNTSITKNGRHAYQRADNYNVFLKVISKDGCEADTTKLFTVNGAVPKANFTISSPTTLCSNRPVNIADGSTVDFGKITKVETYWNYANDPSNVAIDDTPLPGKTYTYSYADFGSPLSKTYQVNYVVYSGITCKSTISKTINVLASPQLTFNPLPSVCAEQNAFQLTTASETTGLPGLGVYSGTGVTQGNIFTPNQSLTGIVSLSYSFAASNGCLADTTQTIRVHPTPTVDAGPDRTILEGGSIIINAVASGNGLTYLWSPPTGITLVQSLTPTVTTVEDMVYTLKATSADGCTAMDQLRVTVLKNVKVPNAFTPNGDNINDTWQIKYLESYPGCEVNVFNRYGQLVYHSTGYSSPWNGTYNGQPLPAATYYYIINPKNGRAPVNGSVTIIR